MTRLLATALLLVIAALPGDLSAQTPDESAPPFSDYATDQQMMLVRDAQVLRAEHRFEEAVELLRRALELGESATTRAALGVALYEAGHLDEALALALILVEHPDEGHRQIGENLRRWVMVELAPDLWGRQVLRDPTLDPSLAALLEETLDRRLAHELAAAPSRVAARRITWSTAAASAMATFVGAWFGDRAVRFQRDSERYDFNAPDASLTDRLRLDARSVKSARVANAAFVTAGAFAGASLASGVITLLQRGARPRARRQDARASSGSTP